MKLLFLCLITLTLCSCKPTPLAIDEPSMVKLGEIQGVPFTDVHFTDQFWLPRMEINRKVSIPSAFHQCEINGRFDNFAVAGGLIKGKQKGDFPFDDTDPYKIIEGASYSLAVKYDAALDHYLDSVITLIAAAQEPDGYLTTCVTNKCTRLSRWWGTHHWEKLNSHELYNSGHLYEAAVAHYRATGKKTLLNVAIKNADLVCKVFGPQASQKHVPSGHPIVEMALIELYGVTGDTKYVSEARYFIDETGRGTDGHKLSEYSQDHKPIMQQDEIVGHAVRAGYLFSGVTDVASVQKDTALFRADERVWNNLVSKKLYITGGMGSRAQGEGFGPNYELNNFNNYCETCASIANVYWQYRMFCASGESKYIDVLERALYNGVISGVSLSGDKFFYDNPLASIGDHDRQAWFGCACCPGNITRFVASVPRYAYATNRKDIYVNLYAGSTSDIKLNGNSINLIQKTNYPWNGDIEIDVNPTQSEEFTLLLRIPGWATNHPVPSDLYTYVDGAKPQVSVTVNGEEQPHHLRGGYFVLDRQWKKNDRVQLHLDMPVRRIQANANVMYDNGLLCMERGPIVYALESIDQNTPYVFSIAIPKDATITPTYEKNLLNGVTVLEGNCIIADRDSITGKLSERKSTFKAIPYSTWDNRGADQLVVWTPEHIEDAKAKPLPTIASQAEMIGGYGYNDQFDPQSSSDINTPYFSWWYNAGTQEHVGYRFHKRTQISSVEIYWLAFDHYDIQYRAPSSWKLFYKRGSQWKEVEPTTPYGTELNKYNVLKFKPIETDELKLVANLQNNKDSTSSDGKRQLQVSNAAKAYSGGIIEWKVNGNNN